MYAEGMISIWMLKESSYEKMKLMMFLVSLLCFLSTESSLNFSKKGRDTVFT